MFVRISIRSCLAFHPVLYAQALYPVKLIYVIGYRTAFMGLDGKASRLKTAILTLSIPELKSRQRMGGLIMAEKHEWQGDGWATIRCWVHPA